MPLRQAITDANADAATPHTISFSSVSHITLVSALPSISKNISIDGGFEGITLNPGETKTVKFTLKPEDFELLDINMKWTVEPGTFDILIGSSSTDIHLSRRLN